METKTREIIPIKGDDCYEITFKNGPLEYKETSKFKGKTYSRFSFNGVIFNVNDDLGFKEALEKQDLATVKLIKSTWMKPVLNEAGEETKVLTEGFEFDTFTKESDSFARAIRSAKHKAQLAVIDRLSMTENLSETTLVSVMGLTV